MPRCDVDHSSPSTAKIKEPGVHKSIMFVGTQQLELSYILTPHMTSWHAEVQLAFVVTRKCDNFV